MNYNPSPRSEFLKDSLAVTNHHTLVEDPCLRKHLAIAMSEMQLRASMNTDATNFNQCAAAHLRMLGAQDFVDIFLNLAETKVTEKRPDVGNLPGNVATLPRKN